MNYRKRSTDLELLHPTMRGGIEATLDTLRNRGYPFRLFEAFRYPERQKYLYAQGRTRATHKKTVTNATAWQSMHQYGCACDCVIDKQGVGLWQTKDGYREWWTVYHEVARSNGIEPIRGELPHVQLMGVSWRDMRDGDWPVGTHDPWAWNIQQCMDRYPKRAPDFAPDYDEDVAEERPGTEDEGEYEHAPF